MTYITLTAPIRSKIHACEEQKETWQRDHQQALLVFDLEDLLGDVVECYDTIQRLDRVFTDSIAHDPHSYDDDFDSTIIELCRRLHRVAEAIDKDLLSGCEQEYGILNNAKEFRDRLSRARKSASFGYRRDLSRRNEELANNILNAIDAN